MDFTNNLIQWYLREKRDLPWRKTPHPYPVWLSEIMLQQTRVAQGLPYFLRFTEVFPTVLDLASADEEQVLKLWQGLGYYSRARNLHATAKHVAFDLNGKFPDNYKDLLKLKGVGEYTAAAIASIAYGEAVPVVDGNVYRVLSRYFDVETDIASFSAKKEFFELAASLLPKDKASEFNQAMMEFGALQCVPKNPNCQSCVFNGSCLALKHNKVDSLPVKLKKTKVTSRYFNYLIIKDSNGNSLIQKRTGKGIWQNLYEFPMLETAQEDDFDSVCQSVEKFSSDFKPTDIKPLHHNPIVHKLSHQHLHIHFWEVKTEQKIEGALTIDEIKKYPFPIAIHNFMEEHWAEV
ncbi:A/G-specific adenine glycosylase [Flavobacterium enshiense DK69]|uniref:Adenine DNA glycosylase n=1 Tax=Flavobacterium enshiense DK69 TaxID=1107311 RepID=V6SA32_9FLAO|nr:A/G-specific adenine glycosylase [Flavobacterium enshiense]ESU23102.1 A/G-specific adenine glycosylase [Flavobacterium enshiense DK69]KGO96034.1 adenine glycosylase [Flavobacterium enshiense DK69]